MTPVPGAVVAQAANGTEEALTDAWRPEWLPAWVVEIAASVGVLVLAYLVSRLVVRLFGRRLARRFDRPSLTRTALSGIRAAVFVVALLVVLRINGLDLGNIALSITVLSAVLGVILAPIVGSVISGVFLLADQPYEIGDMIQLDEAGNRGFVEDITLRYTKIFTLDNTFLVIPNGTIRDRDVYNFSAEDPRTRISLSVLVTYESDVTFAQQRFEEVARRVDGVIEGGPNIRIGASRYPAAPDCLIDEFAANGVSLTLRFWVRIPYRIQTVRSAVQEMVYEVVEDEDDLEFAYPHSHMVFDETSGSLSVDRPGSGDGSRPGRRPQVRGRERPRDATEVEWSSRRPTDGDTEQPDEE